MLSRAYSILEIKSLSDEQRVITGMASTPTVDRGGDIIDPLGVEFKNPLPLLLHHDKTQPVGQVWFTASAKGIEFRAHIPQVSEPGIVRDRVDEAWHSAKYRLLTGASIGWRPTSRPEVTKSGDVRYPKIEVVEMSMVTVPMNAETTIQSVKSLDQFDLAASGREATIPQPDKPAGVTASVVLHARKGATAMTHQERIKSLENSRAAKAGELETIQAKVDGEGRTKDAAERESFDTLKDEIKSIDAELADAKDLEAITVKTTATRVDVKSVEDGTRIRGGESTGIITLKPTLAKGTLFTRYAMALAAGKGSLSDALMFAKRWDAQTPEVSRFVRDTFTKAVEGTSTGGSPAWGEDLVYAQNLVSEFIDLLRAATVMDKLTGVRRVPFNVRIPVQTGGSTVNWVGESAAKPVTQLNFDAVTLDRDKIAGIVVLTDELVRLSSPSAEEVVRRDLVEQIARFMDEQFLDPTITVSSSRPASITNGVASPSATGADADALYKDLNIALATFDNAELGTNSVHIITTPALARGISALRNALGQFEFTGVGVGGGTLMGFPLIVSSSVPSGTIIIVKADEILIADDGKVTLDASREATLDMNGGNSPTFNLFQKNCVAVRAERWVTWRKRRADAVAVIDTATYGPA